MAQTIEIKNRTVELYRLVDGDTEILGLRNSKGQEHLIVHSVKTDLWSLDKSQEPITKAAIQEWLARVTVDPWAWEVLSLGQSLHLWQKHTARSVIGYTGAQPVVGPPSATDPKGAAGSSSVTGPVTPKAVAGKPALSLIPLQGLIAEAQALQHGVDRYARNSWRLGGIPWSQCVDAILRHANALADGEWTDADGLPHVGCIRAWAGVLATYKITHPEQNDLTRD